MIAAIVRLSWSGHFKGGATEHLKSTYSVMCHLSNMLKLVKEHIEKILAQKGKINLKQDLNKACKSSCRLKL